MLILRQKSASAWMLLATTALGLGLLISQPLRAAPAIPAETQVAQSTTGEAVATEETNALERALESKVHEILDGVIKADKYAVYVQVKMKADAKQLQAYYDEKALQTLPGIPSPDPETASPSNNKLYSMIQSRKVIVVLDKLVTGDQEILTKEILKAKLAINEAKGDSIDIRHSEVPNSSDRSPASTPPTPPPAHTEDWVKYFLIGLACCLGLAMVVLLWQVSILRERVDARAKLKADIKVDQSTDANTVMRNAGPLSQGEDGQAGENNQNQGDIRESDPISSAELKEKILTLAVSQPKACSLVARKLMSTREGMRKLSVACEAIGFEYTKQLFDTVSPAKWRAMGEYLRANLNEITRTPVGPILLEIYTDMLAESMGWDPSQNAEGPFDFLHKISEPELVRLFANEEPSHIAFIAAYWEPEEMTQVLSVLTDHRRKEAILQIARLKALPREVVQAAAVRFAERLRVMRSRNEVEVDGSQVVARMLSAGDGESEEELLKFIEREDPATRDRLRTHYFSFDSVYMVPNEVLALVFENADPTLVTQALVGADEMIIQAVMNVMPPKQRSIIEDDVKIATLQNTIPKNETSSARKQLVVELRKALKDRGIELHQLAAGGGTPPMQETSHFSMPTQSDSPPLATAETMAIAEPMSEAAPAYSDMPTAEVVTATAEPSSEASIVLLDPSSDEKAA